MASIGNPLFHSLDFHTISVMHQHSNTIVLCPNLLSTSVTNNNPVSSKEMIVIRITRRSMIIQENNIIIAHARMRTPTEELEYACFQPGSISALQPRILEYIRSEITTGSIKALRIGLTLFQ